MTPSRRCNRIFASIAVFLLAVISPFPSARADEGAQGKVVELTDKTFEHQTQASTGMTTGSWFVKFYASWCGHCKNMAGAYNLLAMDEELMAKGIVIGKVEVPHNRDVGTRFGIKGFPTLYFLHRKKMYKYSGPRTVDAMKAFLLSGYEETEALSIPAAPTFMDHAKETAHQIFIEVVDAVHGKAGKTTQWAFILTGVLFAMTFLSFVLILLMPVKTTHTKNEINAKQNDVKSKDVSSEAKAAEKTENDKKKE